MSSHVLRQEGQDTKHAVLVTLGKTRARCSTLPQPRVFVAVAVVVNYFHLLCSTLTDYVTKLCNCFARVLQLLSVYTASRHLRSSSDTRTLRIPFIKTKSFDQRAFSFTGPTQWNFLPYGLRHSKSSPAFNTALKTHLFRYAF